MPTEKTSPMTRRTKQKMQTREKLYNCALELFMERSFDEVKITDIVEKIGVSVGTFYYHFPSKEDIIDEGYRRFDADLETLWAEQPPMSAREGILFLISEQIRAVVDMGVELASIFFKNQLGIEHQYYFNAGRFLYDKLYENVKSVKGDAAKELTDAILRISRGIIYDWCLHNGDYDVLEIGLHDIKIYLDYYEF